MTSKSVQVDRAQLLDALTFVSGALSQRELIPILSAFCFDADLGMVVCFDDTVTMCSKCPDLGGFHGGLSGSVVLPWIKSQRGESIKFTYDDATVTLTCGRSTIKVPVLPASDFQFQIPEADPKYKAKDEEGSFLSALRFANASAGTDPAHSWRLGVTLDFFKGGCELLSSDNMTVSTTECGLQSVGLLNSSVVLPGPFLSAVLSAKQAPVEWIFALDQVGAIYPDRGIYCRALGLGSPHKHRAVLEGFQWKTFCKIPEDLKSALSDASLVFLSKEEDVVSLIVSKETLTVYAKTDRGESRSVLEYSGSGSLEVKVSIASLMKHLESCKGINITGSAIQLRGELGDRLVAVLGE
jgi:DNA polymerase III sliding clamp (beta) subunit (PCNA family)